MAVKLKRIESEFILATVKSEHIPLFLDLERTTIAFTVQAMDKSVLRLSAAKPPSGLRMGMSVSLTFNFHGQKMVIRTNILSFEGTSVSVDCPPAVLRDLTRRFERIPYPEDIVCRLSFGESQYDLAYPRIDDFDSLEDLSFSDSFANDSVRGLIMDFEAWSKEVAQERNIILFKERAPESVEELIISQTGKALYLPSSSGGYPESDSPMAAGVLTRDMLASWFLMRGTQEGFEREEVFRLVNNKKTQGILSELYQPVVFHQYVIGYVALRNTSPGKPPIDYAALRHVHDFARILARALRNNGFFSGNKTEGLETTMTILDLSPQGILFSIPDTKGVPALPLNSTFSVKLVSGERTMELKCRTLRKFADHGEQAVGAAFTNVNRSDFSFLHEQLYGRGISDEEMDEYLKSTLFP